MDGTLSTHCNSEVDLLHAIGSRMAAADPFHEVLSQVVECAVALVKCDSCFVYVLEGQDLILRGSKNPHEDQIDKLKIRVGQGITGWVAQNRTVVALAKAPRKIRASNFSTSCPKINMRRSCRSRCSAAAAWSASSISSTSSRTSTGSAIFA